MRKNKIIKLLF